MIRKKLVTTVILLGLALTACGVNPQPTAVMQKPLQTEPMVDALSTEDMMLDHSTATVKTDAMIGEPDEMTGDSMGVMAESTAAISEGIAEDMSMMEGAPNFFNAALSDAATGQGFAIQDFSGKVVLVETMAMWCPNCLKQQKQVRVLREMLGVRDDFVSLGLDIDPNEKVDDLRNYVTRNGFDWKYAIAPTEMAREIGTLYGDQFLNPTSTPMFIIDRHGQVHLLPFGIKGAEDLQNALDPFLNEQM